MVKRRLGKGLTALIPDLPEAGKDGVQEINITEIFPNRNQPRQDFDREKLEQLAQSIVQHGVLQPVVLRKVEGGYELVAGERRWRAARIAGLKSIPAIIKELDDRQVMELALIENLQREDLNPIEEAEAYKKLIDEFGLTQEEISVAVGRSRSAIANMLRLLALPADIKQLIREEVITAGHARTIIPLEDRERKEVVERIIRDNLSVRETEKLVSMLVEKRKKKPKKEAKKTPWMVEVENSLGELLGTRVHLVQGRNKGKIEIEYYTTEDLERILEYFKR